ncbi:hypothetical protein CGLO_05151 [Colletotrichum gloeosporioides Cg-14]|uniref:Uncharacterized protein n=1 Tax=Colletotrichum gloeosporioides (strain Cg-14) TaxID=1237896 RepID=T0KSA3_COLGC|nr:hypothetical protein CGLO_05151 [Colletotrichum gloeosporioides Cg-14]
MAKLSAVLGGTTYFVWVCALVVYGLAIWGSSSTGMKDNYVVGLSNSDGQTMNITLGYFGICVYSGSQVQTGSETNSISECKSIYYFPDNNGDNDDGSSADSTVLVEHFIDELNLENDATLNRGALETLLLAARILKEKVFVGNWMIAAFVLLILSGIFAIIPLFFYHTAKRRTISMFLMALAGLFMGFGLMAVGAAASTTTSALALLGNEENLASTLGLETGPIVFSDSTILHTLTWTAVGLNAVFVFFATISAVIRNHRKHMKQKHGGGHRPAMAQAGHRKPLLGGKGFKGPRGRAVGKKFRR